MLLYPARYGQFVCAIVRTDGKVCLYLGNVLITALATYNHPKCSNNLFDIYTTERHKIGTTFASPSKSYAFSTNDHIYVLQYPHDVDVHLLKKLSQPRWLSGLRRSRVHSLVIARRSLCPEKLGSNPGQGSKGINFSGWHGLDMSITVTKRR